MSKNVVISWGRLNPPTSGHEALVDVVKKQAIIRKAEPHIYLSHSVDKKKNPLDYLTKIRIAQNAFGDIIKRSGAKTIIEVLKYLDKKGYKEVTIVVGSDRKTEFDILVNKYNGKDYTFDKVTVTSQGLERDPDSEVDNIAGMSASKVRKLAYDGEREDFDNAMPSNLRVADISKVYNTLRKVLGKAPKKRVAKRSFNAKTNTKFQKSAAAATTATLSKVQKNKLYKGGLFDHYEPNIKILDFGDGITIDEKEINDYVEMITTYENIEYIEERVLDLQQRKKLGRMMKRLAPRMKRKREIAAKKMATKNRISARASKGAIQLLRKKFAGKQGENYKTLSPSQKIGVDKIIDKKKHMVKQLAKRMLPKVQKAEIQRLRDYRKSKSAANSSSNINK